MTVLPRINELIEKIINECSKWLQQKDDRLQFVDPLDHKEISAHYGATHFAAALIIYGKEKNNQRYIELGEKLLTSIISRWDINMKLPGFHNDFNNFALCLVAEYLGERNHFFEIIKKVILNTPDSNHDTVNWLPMRWYVNLCRYKWTGSSEYDASCKKCAVKISSATYSDGYIDDRIPKGLSYNLQYNVAAVAVMQFLRITGVDINIEKELGALLNAVTPDGDINYFGRGTNQIFAWGLWIYLLASSGQDSEADRAVKYLEKNLPTALENNNLMLNKFHGSQKYMWWDYHYCSVYTAHLLLWLVLSCRDIGKSCVKPTVMQNGESGIHIYKNDYAFVVTFDGRREYAAERGPVIAAIWMKGYGLISCGSFGPLGGAFGNNYCSVESTIRNFFGLYRIIQRKPLVNNKYLRKILNRSLLPINENIEPVFVEPKVSLYDNKISVIWEIKKQEPLMLSIPVFSNDFQNVLRVDGTVVALKENIKIKNQYGWVDLLQSDVKQGQKWELTIF